MTNQNNIEKKHPKMFMIKKIYEKKCWKTPMKAKQFGTNKKMNVKKRYFINEKNIYLNKSNISTNFQYKNLIFSHHKSKRKIVYFVWNNSTFSLKNLTLNLVIIAFVMK